MSNEVCSFCGAHDKAHPDNCPMFIYKEAAKPYVGQSMFIVVASGGMHEIQEKYLKALRAFNKGILDGRLLFPKMFDGHSSYRLGLQQAYKTDLQLFEGKVLI